MSLLLQVSLLYSITAAVAEFNYLELNLPPKWECTAEDNVAIVLDLDCYGGVQQTDHCEKARHDYLAKRWFFLFGEVHGKTLEDVVYESYDQSPNLLKKLDDLTDSAT
ncbi:hypothetical protein P9112_006333 [Eukaryota sp. TZLM1-RC]